MHVGFFLFGSFFCFFLTILICSLVFTKLVFASRLGFAGLTGVFFFQKCKLMSSLLILLSLQIFFMVDLVKTILAVLFDVIVRKIFEMIVPAFFELLPLLSLSEGNPLMLLCLLIFPCLIVTTNVIHLCLKLTPVLQELLLLHIILETDQFEVAWKDRLRSDS